MAEAERNGEAAAMLAAASSYANRGWHVFAVRGKEPATTHGFKDATTDAATLAQWFGDPAPGIGIAIRTGIESGLVIVDIDTPTGGATTLRRLATEHGKLPRTPQVLTGGGGAHIYFQHPGEGKISSSAGVIGDGIDVRGDGAYVVAPPSPHASGRPYKWFLPIERAPLALPPDWLIAAIQARQNGHGPTPAQIIPKGKRNTTLTSMAGVMRRRGFSAEAIEQALVIENRRYYRPPLSEAEINRIANSVARYAPEPDQRAGGSQQLEVVPVSGIEMRSIRWLEKPLWQRSAFQLLAGAKGAGKGTYLAGLAARITSGGKAVIFVASEDSAEIDLKPRLVAAGADVDRCFVIRQHLRLPDDVEELGRIGHEIAATASPLGLLVIDPVANHIGDRSSNSEAEVRDAIAPLNPLADDLDCLVVGVRHLGKDRSRGVLASVLGSTAWVDTPRAVVMIVADDQDVQVRHVQVVAGNRSLNGAAQAFRIEAVPVAGLSEPITRAAALGESEKRVEDLLAAPGRDDSKSAQARELMIEILEREGDQESDTLDSRVAVDTGLAIKTVRNVRNTLREQGFVKSLPERDEFGSVTRWIIGRTAVPWT